MTRCASRGGCIVRLGRLHESMQQSDKSPNIRPTIGEVPLRVSNLPTIDAQVRADRSVAISAIQLTIVLIEGMCVLILLL